MALALFTVAMADASSSQAKTKSMEDSDDEPEQLQYKVILLGDGAVGKTSIAMRFTEDHFAKQYKQARRAILCWRNSDRLRNSPTVCPPPPQTIGLDFFIKRLVLPGDVQVALQIWDIGGQTIGGKMIGNYIYGAQAVLLCYDVTNYSSFANLEDWFRLVRRTFSGGATMPYLALVGNKMDLNHMRGVKLEKHTQFADENDMASFFMSAKTGDSVAQCFYRVASELSGVVLTKPELEVASKVVKAQIINHPQHADDAPPMPEPQRHKKKGGCVVS